jgi:hypothetical protein
VVLFGGYDPSGAGTALGDTWTWNGHAWTPVPGAGPNGRYLSAMAALPPAAVLFGGWDQKGNYLGDTWLWNGTWSETSATSGVGPRQGHAIATLGTKAVLFGGYGATALYGDTWLWDGSSWTQAKPAGSTPQARADHAMAALNGKVVLFGGGTSATNNLADTWLWDGVAWTEVTGVQAPSARANHAMATLGNKVVLFGGVDDTGHVLGDTWQWDGSSWSCVAGCSGAAMGPPGRYAAGTAALGGIIVLFGGIGAKGDLGDTWIWDGASWASAAAADAGPGPRDSVAMTVLPDVS